MASFRQFKRRTIVPLMGVVLAAYYFIVMVPLARHTRELDVPLQKAWQDLSASLEQTNAIAIDFLHITNQLAETKQAITLLDNAKKKAADRLALSEPVRKRMAGTFTLVDYENERVKQLAELNNLAKQCQVTIEPPVLMSFPDFTGNMRQPEFLWAALSMVNSLLATAVQCKVTAIHSLDVPVVLTNEPPQNSQLQVMEIPLQVELTGSSETLLKLLQNLPLRADEMAAAGLPEGHPDKAPLFIERLIIRKQSPEKPDELRVSLRTVGFVLREQDQL